jgi:hypothetical protein
MSRKFVYDLRHVARVSCICCAPLPREEIGPLCNCFNWLCHKVSVPTSHVKHKGRTNVARHANDAGRMELTRTILICK